MAKELMEIGGFITSGAEIVNHDNSLSGNGTVESPLGVVPGYNETVLWSANLSTLVTDRASGTNFNLSETTMNFEKLGVYFAKKWPITGMNDLGYGYLEVPTNFLTTQNGNMLIDVCVRGGGNNYVFHNATLLSGCNTNKITECGGFQQSNGPYTGTFVGTAYCHPYLFIGINRKQ